MCGIAGTLAFDNSTFTVTEGHIAAMRDAMSHRGPDGAGVWVSGDGRAGLGHRRLAINDLSEAAAQPMSNADGTLRIVFNGEIYNHAEIRAELEQSGARRWKTTHSDTEVVLHAFECWGIDCLQKFRGMFAIALWDARRRELWLVRDRIGIKPLYYSIHHGRVNFASEIKALLQDPEQKKALDEEAFYHYLSFLTAPAPKTLFDGIRKLPPATWLRISADGALSEERYWDVLDHTEPLAGVPEEEIASRILSELRTATRLCKMGDVPVGVFLSGGIDSSTNLALFSEGESAPVKSFTIGYRGQYQSYRNELDFARLMASRVGAEHHERLLDLDDLVEFMPRMIYQQDEPIADPVCVPNYYVCALARDNGVTVCQVGEGADELFWGYPHWKMMLRLQNLDNLPVPRFLKRAGLQGLKAIGRRERCDYEWLRRGGAGQPVFWTGAESFTEAHKDVILSPRLRDKFTDLSSWEVIEPVRRRFVGKAWEQAPLPWMTYLDLSMRLPELLLMRLDKMSAAASLEGRVPFLDHKFVELAMSIPQSVKTKNGTLKYILKKAVRGLIPDQIIDRPKQGFAVPVSEWLFDRLGGIAAGELKHFCRETDILNEAEALRLVAEGRHHQAWHLFNFVLWWKEFMR